eukprot:2642-Heterococcus_DN1.PRE.4
MAGGIVRTHTQQTRAHYVGAVLTCCATSACVALACAHHAAKCFQATSLVLHYLAYCCKSAIGRLKHSEYPAVLQRLAQILHGMNTQHVHPYYRAAPLKKLCVQYAVFLHILAAQHSNSAACACMPAPEQFGMAVRQLLRISTMTLVFDAL